MPEYLLLRRDGIEVHWYARDAWHAVREYEAAAGRRGEVVRWWLAEPARHPDLPPRGRVTDACADS